MKSSFGGGGGMGGGRMLSTAIRSALGGNENQNGLSKTISSNANKHNSQILSLSLSSSSSASTSLNLPLSGTSPTVSNWASRASSYFCDGDDWEWESVNGNDDQDRGDMIFDNYYAFGAVPSQEEVEDAVSSLKQIVAPALYSRFCEDRSSSSSDKHVTDHTADPARSELDWIEPPLHLYNPRLSQSHQYGRVSDAFHLLQTDPSIQRMVMSLSSDKAVWDAVMNNEVVKELKESVCIAEDANSQRSDESPDTAAGLLKWILDNSKAKVLELIEKLIKLVNEVFQPEQKKNNTAATTDLFEARLRASLLLSIVVLLIVVVTRAHRV
ncbi:uncharacterized protein LOC122086249 [Macadamia integrifolia]|uniref:uncharacterized protein LOC122086249 n=1 Tax=Macadamia integrifolia TaxID=60698 RepID=UPI001C4F5E4E|nr:uncharacterized protein LOC122086249 [Macadamia integrifolia]